jgi:hypothetical protein
MGIAFVPGGKGIGPIGMAATFVPGGNGIGPMGMAFVPGGKGMGPIGIAATFVPGGKGIGPIGMALADVEDTAKNAPRITADTLNILECMDLHSWPNKVWICRARLTQMGH